jgi:hypothetical protein
VTRRVVVALLVAVALVLLPAGCGGGSSPKTEGGWHDGTVALVGDSMAFEAAADFERLAGERGWTLSITAVPGTTFADRRADIAALHARFASAVVVELGTNDALHDGDFTAAEAADIDRAVTALDRVGCVLFVNAGLLEPRNHDVLRQPPWDDYAPGLEAAQALNAHLAAAVRPHRNMHVFDWFAAYNAHADWTRDFVHLKAEHRAGYARLVLDALSDACGPGTTAS